MSKINCCLWDQISPVVWQNLLLLACHLFPCYCRAVAAGPVSPVSHFPSFMAPLALPISAIALSTPTQGRQAHTGDMLKLARSLQAVLGDLGACSHHKKLTPQITSKAVFSHVNHSFSLCSLNIHMKISILHANVWSVHIFFTWAPANLWEHRSGYAWVWLHHWLYFTVLGLNMLIFPEAVNFPFLATSVYKCMYST